MRDNGRPDEGPGVEPGQIWLIETPVTSGLPPLDRGMLGRADVVLYDCKLAPLITDVLPASSYAEPLSTEAEEGAPAISARALKLASDGWRVVQLVQSCHPWRRRLRGVAEELGRLSGTRELAIRLIAKTATDPSQIQDACLCDLQKLVDGAADDEPLTVIVGPLAGGASAAVNAITANGLAG